MNAVNIQRYYLPLIILITLAITLTLAFSTYDINYWPTDSYYPYIPTAATLFENSFLSQMHELPETEILKITMRGKEALILGIASMQKILNDSQSLYPNILFLIITTGITSILFYFVFKNLFNPHIGFIASLSFTTCFWPYMYVLQGAHQPLVLMNCILSMLFLLTIQKPQGHILTGITIGFMFFSSPTAPAYLIYVIGVFFYKEFFDSGSLAKKGSAAIKSFYILIGFTLTCLLFLLPHPIQNISRYIQFIGFSQHGNNFAVYHQYLAQFYPIPAELRGGGWLWIWKYFLLTLPIIFPIFLISLVYLLFHSIKRRILIFFILICLSTPIIVETSGVAQFGRNYYSWFLGIIALICCALDYFRVYFFPRLSKNSRRLTFGVIGIVLAVNICVNGVIFFSDVYPARMATTNIHHWLIKNKQIKINVYNDHPRNQNFVKFLNNPKQKLKIVTHGLDNIRQASSHYILIPPITGKSIFQECRLSDFSADIYLTELYNSPDFEKFVVTSFPTLASSKMWTQEEEICTYVDLILDGISPKDREKGLVYILDAKKLQEEWFVNLPKTLFVVP